MLDFIELSGWVKVTVTDKDGSEFVYENKNLVVTSGRVYLASRLIDNSAAPMDHIAIGTGTASPDLINTTLIGEHARVAALGSTSTNFSTFTAVFPGALFPTPIDITEVGIFNDATVGTMMARFVFPPQTLDNTKSLTISWSIKLG